jgi:DeoR family transcriptional regulator of aga operon
VIGLTGGTTTTEVGRELVDRSLTAVTNALNIASELAIRPNIKLVVTGGTARPESYELDGEADPGELRAIRDAGLLVTVV